MEYISRIVDLSGKAYDIKDGGARSEISGKQDALTFDNAPTKNSTNMVNSGAVYTALEELKTEAVSAMVFKGTLGSGGTVTSLPSASAATLGYTYKVITDGTYAGTAAKIGDVFSCAYIGSGYSWELVPSGDEPSGDVVGPASSANSALAAFNGTDGKLLKKAASAGSTKQGVYIDANGIPQAMSYELNKSVPANAVFTDTNTTYTLTQDANDGHKLTLTGSDGTSVTVTIPDKDTTYTLSTLGIGNVKNYDQSKAIKSITRSGTTFTYTCLDNTTGTFTQQDNNTWTAMVGATASANGSAGYVPAPPKDGYNTKYLRADGTWAVPPNTDTNTTYTVNTESIGSASNGTAIAADDITSWNAGSTPTLGTAIAADDITSWSAGTLPSASVSNGILTLGMGALPSLSYTARSIPNVTNVGSTPSLSYTARSIPNISVTSKTVVTGLTEN